MASVIASGSLISPGFSKPSVIWCMLRLSEKEEQSLLENLYLSGHVTHKQFEIEPV